MLFTDPVVLENAWARLEPLSPADAVDLAAASIGLEHAWYSACAAGSGLSRR